eukprot:4429565-Amphidinium_carterae.1
MLRWYCSHVQRAELQERYGTLDPMYHYSLQRHSIAGDDLPSGYPRGFAEIVGLSAIDQFYVQVVGMEIKRASGQSLRVFRDPGYVEYNSRLFRRVLGLWIPYTSAAKSLATVAYIERCPKAFQRGPERRMRLAARATAAYVEKFFNSTTRVTRQVLELMVD